MQLPVDISAVLKAAGDIEGAAKTPISVAVYLDEDAPAGLAAHVRAAFASPSPRVRVTVGYLCDEAAPVPEGGDMAVIAAGPSGAVGAQASALREAGVPVLVAAMDPQLVADAAAAAGFPIPEGDLCAPDGKDAPSAAASFVRSLGAADADAADEQPHLAEDLAEAVGSFSEDLALTPEEAEQLDGRMGRWICAAIPEKRLAFALAFAFVRRPLALDSVNATSLQNAAVGAVAFIPGADMPIMTLNQMKMLLQIAAAYGQPLNAQRAKELVAVVGGAFLLRSVARSVAGIVPVLGWAVRAGVGYAGTEAMGRAAIDYFEAGGSLTGLASVVQTAAAGAVDTAREASATPAGKAVLGGARRALAAGRRALAGTGR